MSNSFSSSQSTQSSDLSQESKAPKLFFPPPSYFQSPNDLVDHWLPHLDFVELKCLLVIIRQTLGWKKTRDRISLTQMEKFTGSNKSNIGCATEKLQSKGLIIKETLGNPGNQETYYEINFYNPNNSYQSQGETGRGLTERRGGVSPRDPQQTLVKDTCKRQQTTQVVAAVFSDEEEKRELLKPYGFCPQKTVELLVFDINQIRSAIENFLQYAENKGVANPQGYLFTAITKGWRPNKTISALEKEIATKEKLQEELLAQQEIERFHKERLRRETMQKARDLRKIHSEKFQKDLSFTVHDESINVITPEKTFDIPYSDPDWENKINNTFKR